MESWVFAQVYKHTYTCIVCHLVMQLSDQKVRRTSSVCAGFYSWSSSRLFSATAPKLSVMFDTACRVMFDRLCSTVNHLSGIFPVHMRLTLSGAFIWELPSPYGINPFWGDPHKAHWSSTIVVQVSLLPCPEINHVTIDGCLFSIWLPWARTWTPPVPRVAGILVVNVLLVDLLRRVCWDCPPQVIVKRHFEDGNGGTTIFTRFRHQAHAIALATCLSFAETVGTPDRC